MQSVVKRCSLAILTILAVSITFSGTSSRAFPQERPKLVVIITLDQFRAEYIKRLDAAFQGGFRRLLDEGWRYENAIADHAPTLSFPGHTTIATGSYPRTHGVTQNDIIVDRTQRRLLLQDNDEQILGFPAALSFSSKKIRVGGIADWIRAADPKARTVALSTGFGLALCYGGKPQSDRTQNHVYWLDSSAGRFVTSTYHRDEYPVWLQRFNDEALPEYKKHLVWENSVPEEHRHLARRDDAPYEGDGEHTTFPHRIEHRYPDPGERWVNMWFHNYSPHAKEALFDLAKESIKVLELGQRDSTDLLTIALKITDRIGHDYGPYSLEQLDNILRVDRELGEFFDFLDKTIGKDQYLLVLSADHGAPNIVEYELEQGRSAKRVSEDEINNLLLSIERFIDGYSGPEDELTSSIARELEKADFVARAMTPEDLAGTGPADHILLSYRKSYIPEITTTFPLWTNNILRGVVSPKHPGNYGIIVEYAENAQLYTARSAHASSYLYDQEVPIIFFGKGIRKGVAEDLARTIDIAPTLAHLAGVPHPATVDGKVLDIR